MTSYESRGYTVLSCTTDGFLVESKGDREEGFGIFSEMYEVALRNLGIDKYFLEEKHMDEAGIYT